MAWSDGAAGRNPPRQPGLDPGQGLLALVTPQGGQRDFNAAGKKVLVSLEGQAAASGKDLPQPTPPRQGHSPMLECFRRRQIRASLSSFW